MPPTGRNFQIGTMNPDALFPRTPSPRVQSPTIPNAPLRLGLDRPVSPNRSPVLAPRTLFPALRTLNSPGYPGAYVRPVTRPVSPVPVVPVSPRIPTSPISPLRTPPRTLFPPRIPTSPVPQVTAAYGRLASPASPRIPTSPVPVVTTGYGRVASPRFPASPPY